VAYNDLLAGGLITRARWARTSQAGSASEGSTTRSSTG
jgi:hypothetical protein